MATYTFRISDKSIDRHGDVIIPEGIDTSKAELNCPVFFNHEKIDWNTWSANKPVGQANNFQLRDGGLYADITLSNSNDGRELDSLIAEGTLKAVSVGVYATKTSTDPDDMFPGQTGITITESELIEVSIVTIPANPNAVIEKADLHNTITKGAYSVKLDAAQGSIIERSTNFKKPNNMFKKFKAFLQDFNQTEKSEKEVKKIKDDVSKTEMLAATEIERDDAIKQLTEKTEDFDKLQSNTLNFTDEAEMLFNKIEEKNTELEKKLQEAVELMEKATEMFKQYQEGKEQEISENTAENEDLKKQNELLAKTIEQNNVQLPVTKTENAIQPKENFGTNQEWKNSLYNKKQ